MLSPSPPYLLEHLRQYADYLAWSWGVAVDVDDLVRRALGIMETPGHVGLAREYIYEELLAARVALHKEWDERSVRRG